MISPNVQVLAEKHCDVLETMMDGDSTQITVPFNNWGSCRTMVKKETKIGFFEEVTTVDESDERDWWIFKLGKNADYKLSGIHKQC